MTEKVILVDSNDHPLGLMEKIEAHRKGLLHRAVSVFIFNSEKALLLQQRADNKYHSPNLWTNTACTHPRPEESNKESAIRRLEEEMGIYEENLTEIFDFIYKEELDNKMIEHELDHVFIGFSNNRPAPNPKEVKDSKYVTVDQLKIDIEKYPEQYTVWFKKIVPQVISHIL